MVIGAAAFRPKVAQLLRVAITLLLALTALLAISTGGHAQDAAGARHVSANHMAYSYDAPGAGSEPPYNLTAARSYAYDASANVPQESTAAGARLLAAEGPSTLIFRSMRMGEGGLPELGSSARTLGARAGTDIPINDGLVSPGTGGMSVSPNDAMNLPVFRRPPSLGGIGKDPVWCMDVCDLPSGLSYRADPLNPAGHGFIEPSATMGYEPYEGLLEGTAGLWRLVAQ